MISDGDIVSKMSDERARFKCLSATPPGNTPYLARVLQRFAAGQGAEPGFLAGDVGLDCLEIGPRQVPQCPFRSPYE